MAIPLCCLCIVVVWESPGRNAQRPPERRAMAMRINTDSSSVVISWLRCWKLALKTKKGRFWRGQGDVFPFFSPLTGLHCGFVCGKPWFRTSLNSQTQMCDLKVKLKSDFHYNICKSCSIDVTMISCRTSFTHCRTVRLIVASLLKDTETGRDITYATLASI